MTSEGARGEELLMRWLNHPELNEKKKILPLFVSNFYFEIYISDLSILFFSSSFRFTFLLTTYFLLLLDINRANYCLN